MENTKIKITLALFIGFLLASSYASCAEKKYTLVTDTVYKDKKGNVYFKGKNKYIENIFNTRTGKLKLLKDYVDLKSIKRIGIYFKDRNYIYMISGRRWLPYEFHFIPYKKANFFGAKKYYLKTTKSIYFAGSLLKDLDYKSAKYFTVPNLRTKLNYEFIGDKNQIYIQGDKCSIDDICWFALERKTKISLLNKYYKGKNGNIEYCDKLENEQIELEKQILEEKEKKEKNK